MYPAAELTQTITQLIEHQLWIGIYVRICECTYYCMCMYRYVLTLMYSNLANYAYNTIKWSTSCIVRWHTKFGDTFLVDCGAQQPGGTFPLPLANTTLDSITPYSYVHRIVCKRSCCLVINSSWSSCQLNLPPRSSPRSKVSLTFLLWRL